MQRPNRSVNNFSGNFMTRRHGKIHNLQRTGNSREVSHGLMRLCGSFRRQPDTKWLTVCHFC